MMFLSLISISLSSSVICNVYIPFCLGKKLWFIVNRYVLTNLVSANCTAIFEYNFPMSPSARPSLWSVG